MHNHDFCLDAVTEWTLALAVTYVNRLYSPAEYSGARQ